MFPAIIFSSFIQFLKIKTFWNFFFHNLSGLFVNSETVYNFTLARKKKTPKINLSRVNNFIEISTRNNLKIEFLSRITRPIYQFNKSTR